MFGSKKEVEFTVSNRTIARILLFFIGAGLIIGFFEKIAHPLTLIFVSFFLALALNPAVTLLAKKMKNQSRTRATTISYVTIITVLIAFFSLILPPLISQTTEFINDVPQTIRDLSDDQGAIGNFIRNNNLEDQVTQLANNWADNSNVGDQAVGVASRVVSNLISIVTVVVLTFMMLVEGPMWMKKVWKYYPEKNKKHAQGMTKKMNQVVTNYVNGQVIIATIGSIFSIITLLIATTVFNVDGINAVALGGIVFLFSLIPMFGALIASIIVVLFSLISSVPLAITMAIYFIVYQQIENATIQPIIQSRGNELTPMLVFIAAILGVGFGGVLGAFVAIPLFACVKLLVDDYLERHRSRA